MAAAHGMSYYLGLPESEVLLDGIVVPVRLAPSDPVPRLQLPEVSTADFFQDISHWSHPLSGKSMIVSWLFPPIQRRSPGCSLGSSLIGRRWLRFFQVATRSADRYR